MDRLRIPAFREMTASCGDTIARECPATNVTLLITSASARHKSALRSLIAASSNGLRKDITSGLFLVVQEQLSRLDSCSSDGESFKQ
jgi:hypothetical protein